MKNKDFTERQIEKMEAATLRIDKFGIQELTIKNLASDLSLSEAALYRHFKSKNEILLGLLTYVILEMNERLAVIIEDKEKQQQSDDTEVASQIHKKSSTGLTLADATSIREIVPGVQKVSPEVVYNTFVVKSGVRGNARFSGIEPDFFEVYNLELFEGKMFSNWQLENAAPVCIIGPDIRARYFKQENPIGKKIKCGGIWLEVIGITKSRTVSETATKSMGVSEFNNSI